MDVYILQEYYANYLRTIRNLKESSINHYFDGLKKISRILKDKDLIKESIYEITNLDSLEFVCRALKEDEGFNELDKRGHQMYSSAMNNYLKFARGDDFFKRGYAIENLDMPLIIKENQKVYTEKQSRSSIVKIQSLKASKYNCEIDNNHKTFTAKSNLEQYMEGHHLIPLSMQDEFKYSLDNYANIVCLCPICYRLLHYGVDSEKKEYLEELYKARYKRLCNIGIELSCYQF